MFDIRKQRICVYTCITGNYDNLKEVERQEGLEYLCFTNNEKIQSTTWRIIKVEEEGLDNRTLARKIKIIGHEYIDANFDISVWIDGASIVRGDIYDFLEKNDIQNADMIAFKHSIRNCVYDEAIACVINRKETIEKIREQVSFLEKEKYPRNAGLIESTVYVKKHLNEVVKNTMELWFSILLKYSGRDQLGFNYAASKNNIKINWIEKNAFHNEWFTWQNHSNRIDFSEIRVFYGEYKNLYEDKFEDIKIVYKNNKYTIEIEKNETCTDIILYFGQALGKVLNIVEFSGFVLEDVIFRNVNRFQNAFILDNECFVMRVKNKNQKIVIVFEILELETEMLLDALRQFAYNKNAELKAKDKDILYYKDRLNEVVNSKGWLMLEKLRGVKRRK